MNKLQILVAAMGQQDFSLGEEMNIRCSAIFANQTDRNAYFSQERDFGTWEMLCSKTQGVGVNRNLALLASDAEILLFADDDLVYYDGVPEQVVRAFETLPEADVILFSMDIMRDGKIVERRRHPVKRIHLWHAMRYGAAVLAVRRRAIQRENIWFHHSFGGGCLYGSGEDSLFLKSCFARGLKVYTHSCVLGVCRKDQSSWFTGYNEKFFFDKGALIRCAFPRSYPWIKWYFACRFSGEAQVPLSRVIRWMNRGIRAFPRGEGYQPQN